MIHVLILSSLYLYFSGSMIFRTFFINSFLSGEWISYFYIALIIQISIKWKSNLFIVLILDNNENQFDILFTLNWYKFSSFFSFSCDDAVICICFCSFKCFNLYWWYTFLLFIFSNKDRSLFLSRNYTLHSSFDLSHNLQTLLCNVLNLAIYYIDQALSIFCNCFSDTL